MVTVAVAFLLFFRWVLFGKGKNNDWSQDVVPEPVEPKPNTNMPQSKTANGILNGSISGIKCNMGTGVIPSHASVEDLLANRKEYLKASVDNKTQDEVSSSEEAECGSNTRSLVECATLLKTPVRPQ